MLAADADLQVRLGRTAALNADLHQAADAIDIDRLERILRDDVRLQVMADEAAIIVTAHAQGGLRQVVGAEAEELRLLRDLVGHHAGARQFNHGAHQVFHLDALFLEHRFRCVMDDLGLSL